MAKDRYDIVVEGKMAEVDILVDKLKGLVLMDFEFNTVEEKIGFQNAKHSIG